MAKKKENLKGMNKSELAKKLKDFNDSLRSLRFKGEGARSKNVREGRNLKKDIARVMTEISMQAKQK